MPERNTEIYGVENRLLKGINVNTCSGPDATDGRTSEFCADPLSVVLRHLLQASIDQHFVSSLWKMSTVIPVPIRSAPKQLNGLPRVVLEMTLKPIMLSALQPVLDTVVCMQGRKGFRRCKAVPFG